MDLKKETLFLTNIGSGHKYSRGAETSGTRVIPATFYMIVTQSGNLIVLKKL